MEQMPPLRHDERIIVHFDSDCFYAAVFEREDPKLKSLPLAVQQKQIIVTCNYEARRRGLYKLQRVKDAKRKCPELIIVLGEDLTRFRNASKDNYHFLRGYTWSNKAERLGFDEVFMDVTDMVVYNLELLNRHDLTTSYFHLDRSDPTLGFSFDASRVSGHTYPAASSFAQDDCPSSSDSRDLLLRLRLGSHLGQHLRHQLEEQKGYTSTVGISTNKLIAKLVGNVNKPKGQTTLLPPYNRSDVKGISNVVKFVDDHDIGKIPGIGFKMAQKIRNHVLGRPATFSAGLVYGPTNENVKVGDVRTLEGMGSELLARLLAGPGTPRDLGEKLWGLMNGVDDAEVTKGKEVPQQISIEDSYIRLDELAEVRKELKMLAKSLIRRMRLDLTVPLKSDDMGMVPDEDEDSTVQDASTLASRRWIAIPRTLRLSTRPRPPLNPDGSRSRTFTRISKSGSMPSWVFSLTLGVDALVEKLLEESLLPLFKKLHPERSGWNLSLVNVCATGMLLTAGDGKDGAGRDIGRMFRRQEDMLKDWKVDDVNAAPSDENAEEQQLRDDNINHRELQNADNRIQGQSSRGSEDVRPLTQESASDNDSWDSEDGIRDLGVSCKACGALMPPFATAAHERFHTMPE